MFRQNSPFTFFVALVLLAAIPVCGILFQTLSKLTSSPARAITITPTSSPARAITMTPTPSSATGVAETQIALVALEGKVNVAVGKAVIDRAGGVNYDPWQHANDAVDYGTTTKADGGRWANETNIRGGTYQIIDLGQSYEIAGVGYRFDWDAAYKNPLTFVVEVSNDQETWVRVSEVIYPYDGVHGSTVLDIKMIPMDPVEARFVKFWEPPDGSWNGWGDIYALRVYAFQ